MIDKMLHLTLYLTTLELALVVWSGQVLSPSPTFTPDMHVYLHFEEVEYTVDEEEGSVEVVLVLNKVAINDVTIQVMDVNGTATVGVDYNTGPYNVTINKGEMKASLFVGIINDNVFENGHSEDFDLDIVPSSLPNGIYLGDIHTTKVNILDDEYKFCFGQSSYLVEERGEITLPVSLNRPLRKDITVNFTYVDLTATGNHTITNQKIDYYTSHEYPNVIFIPAGNTQFNLSVRIENDRRLEDSELFRIITDPPDLPEGEFPCFTDVIIRDDDDFRVTFDEASYTVRENEDITIGLSLIYPEEYDPSVMFPINVTIDEIDGSATGGFEDDTKGADYVYQNYSYFFKDGEKKKSLTIRTIDDNLVEPDESYILFISKLIKGFFPGPPVSRVIVGENGTATITIVNDDDCSVTVVRGSIKLNNRRKRAKLRFSSDGDPIVAYECKLDDKNFKECKSPKVWKNLKKGKHVVTVRAFCTDDKGNRSTIRRRKFNFRIR